MKKTLFFMITIILTVFMIGCSKNSTNEKMETNQEASDIVTKENNKSESSESKETEQKEMVVGVPTAPPALPVLRMIEENALGDDVKISLDIWNEPESLIAMVQDKKHDMFAFPLTVVSKLYNKGIDVRLMNVNTWGVTYFVTSDPEFKDWSDLKDKTVYVPLQSSPPDALTQYFLKEANLTVGEDIEIIYASMAEIAALLAEGKASYATLIEPQVTAAMMKNEDLRVAYSFEEEWQRVTGTETKIPNAGWGTTQQFTDENPELVKKFNEEYSKACQWANENPQEIGVLAEKYLGIKAELVEKGIQNMGLEFKAAMDSKEELDMFYNLLNNFDPKMIGGKIPDEGLYYKE